jgi:hypothetical protein
MTSMMELAGIDVLPVMGHCSAVLTLIVIDS